MIDRVPELGSRAAHVRQRMVDKRVELRAYTREVGDDAPEVRDWVWPFDGVPASAQTDALRGSSA